MSADNSSNSNATAPKPDREKKIYTNDDVEALARNGATTVGNAAGIPIAPDTDTAVVKTSTARLAFIPQVATAERLAPEKDPVWYAQQYVSLSAQLDSIDAEVQRLRNFRQSDAPPQPAPGLDVGLNIYGPCPAISTDALIEQLKQHRAAVVAQMSDLEDRARANRISSEVLRNAEEVATRAGDISRLPAPVQQKVVTQQLQQLQSELNEVREVKSQMAEQAAAQNITLLPPLPETKYGGGFTVDYLKQLDIQQNQIVQELNQAEDEALRVGIPPRALP
jgi:DNA repair exonuclease SbcCD ATPase subunit